MNDWLIQQGIGNPQMGLMLGLLLGLLLAVVSAWVASRLSGQAELGRLQPELDTLEAELQTGNLSDNGIGADGSNRAGVIGKQVDDVVQGAFVECRESHGDFEPAAAKAKPHRLHVAIESGAVGEF